MENENPPSTSAKKPANKWLRLGRKILIGAIITYCVNFFLLKTGWDTWEKFSKQADTFAGSMLDGAIRLSPLNLYHSLQSEEKTYGDGESRKWYVPESESTGTVSLKSKVKRWFGYYWYNTEGHAFWVGRIILIIALIVGFGSAKENYDKEPNKTMALVAFPFQVVFRFVVFLLALGLVALGLFLVIKLLLFVVGGLVIIFSSLMAGGGIVKILAEESKNEATDASKKTIAAALLPFLFKGKSK